MKSRGRSPVLNSSSSSERGVRVSTNSSNAAPTTSIPTRAETAATPGTSGNSGSRGSVSGRSSGEREMNLGGDREQNVLSVPKASSDSGSVEGMFSSQLSPCHQSRLALTSDNDSISSRTPIVEGKGGGGGSSNSNNGSVPDAGLGNSVFYDDPDLSGIAHTPDPAMTQKAIDQIQGKVEKTKDLIKEEQTSRDDNVNEYLKLSSNADRQQQIRIKQVFEKKNQKSAQNIAHYQKKLEEYNKRVQDLQEHGIRPKHTKKLGQGLKQVRDGISGMSNSVMSKPKEFAHLLKNKFGSADNLSSISKDSDSGGVAGGDKDSKKVNRSHHGSASLPRENSGGGISGGDRHSSFGSQRQSALSASQRKCISDDGRRSERSESLATTSDSDKDHHHHQQHHHHRHHHHHPGSGAEARAGVSRVSPQAEYQGAGAATEAEWNAVMQELSLHKEEVGHCREEMDDLRQHFQQKFDSLREEWREERDRYERLEEQMNDLTELHQHEIENIKSGVNDMEEKVQYQSEERLLDIKEHLQSLETKVNSMEHQQAQQQYLNIDSLDSTNARAVLMKLLSTLIGFVHLVFLFLGTVINLLKPFLRTTPRVFISLTVILLSCSVYYKQDVLLEHYLRFKQQRELGTSSSWKGS